VPYIGGTAVQDRGFDGSGIKVAVLDSGVDFTHASLGGPGTVEFYEQCYGVSPPVQVGVAEPHNAAPVGECAKYFGPARPRWSAATTSSVSCGRTAPERPDPNPIDLEGHGTHVADIIAGEDGVAPGADIYAVKVCSAVSSACSGIALIQGMEFSADPNGDGRLSDRVDIINMSLGSRPTDSRSTTTCPRRSTTRRGSGS
jgi:minor extracellular serine protease Vpr